jgi:hypothetical protein
MLDKHTDSRRNAFALRGARRINSLMPRSHQGECNRRCAVYELKKSGDPWQLNRNRRTDAVGHARPDARGRTKPGDSRTDGWILVMSVDIAFAARLSCVIFLPGELGGRDGRRRFSETGTA